MTGSLVIEGGGDFPDEPGDNEPNFNRDGPPHVSAGGGGDRPPRRDGGGDRGRGGRPGGGGGDVVVGEEDVLGAVAEIAGAVDVREAVVAVDGTRSSRHGFARIPRINQINGFN